MFLLIAGIILCVLFIIYMGWVYIKSSVMSIKGFVNDEYMVKNVPMKQFFHFNRVGDVNDKRKI